MMELQFGLLTLLSLLIHRMYMDLLVLPVTDSCDLPLLLLNYFLLAFWVICVSAIFHDYG